MTRACLAGCRVPIRHGDEVVVEAVFLPNWPALLPYTSAPIMGGYWHRRCAIPKLLGRDAEPADSQPSSTT